MLDLGDWAAEKFRIEAKKGEENEEDDPLP